MIDDDAYPACLLAADACLLELGEREAAALAHFAVVAHGLAADGGPEELERAHAQRGGFRLARGAAAELAPGLVEPGLYPALPVLAEVVAVEDCRGVGFRGADRALWGRGRLPLLCRKPMKMEACREWVVSELSSGG